ncbi:hypothetical protein BC938DRAFT_475937 [Jimgerdemannia flammicorona]|uniref:Uncharacterized protein n=1 Tax=Jimgerdemannia flammicorona TaxID=994334 RepID=A0A433PLZ6_9FUNG|nr:hypothetical protein BC938DRAFT_475937 [Jimgerdemannia flammicorona]
MTLKKSERTHSVETKQSYPHPTPCKSKETLSSSLAGMRPHHSHPPVLSIAIPNSNRPTGLSHRASGLGEGTVHELVRLGANVSTLGDNAFYPGPVDITSEDAVKSAVAATIKRFGKLSGVINLGGILKIARVRLP